MPFGRRKPAHRSRETTARDPFRHLADERRAAESDAWFLQPDDGPELDVQAGISSNLRNDDLDGAGGDDRDTRADGGQAADAAHADTDTTTGTGTSTSTSTDAG